MRRPSPARPPRSRSRRSPATRARAWRAADGAPRAPPPGRSASAVLPPALRQPPQSSSTNDGHAAARNNLTDLCCAHIVGLHRALPRVGMSTRNADEKPTGGLWVEQQRSDRLVQALEPHACPVVVERAIPLEPTEADPGRSVFTRRRKQRDRVRVYADADARLLRHLLRVTPEPEAGDVGSRMQLRIDRRARCAAVQSAYRRYRGGESGRVESAVLVRCREDAGADRFGEPERIALAETRLEQDSLRMYAAGDGETVIRLAVDHGVPAGHDAARLGDLVDRALEDTSELRKRRVLRPRGDVEGEQDLASHRVAVGHRVRGADRTGGIRVVHDRREEVERLDDRDVARDQVDGRVVGHIEANKQLRGISLFAHRTQHLRQRAWAQLGPSAGAGGERRQPDLIAGEHGWRWYSGKWRRGSDGRIPDRRGEGDEKQREAEVRSDPSALQDDKQQDDRRAGDEREIEEQ